MKANEFIGLAVIFILALGGVLAITFFINNSDRPAPSTEPPVYTFIDTVEQLDVGYRFKNEYHMPVKFNDHHVIFTNLESVLDTYAYFVPGHTYEVTMKPTTSSWQGTGEPLSFRTLYWELIEVREVKE